MVWEGRMKKWQGDEDWEGADGGRGSAAREDGGEKGSGALGGTQGG